jgi:hypothetical protein
MPQISGAVKVTGFESHPGDPHLRAWLRLAHQHVDDRFADARAHAQAGNLLTADDRLEELRRALIGVTIQTSAGLVGDAQAAFYRHAIDHWRRTLPPDLLTLVNATPEGEDVARGARGRKVELDRAIDEARRQLRAIVLSRQPQSYLDLWHDQQARAVKQKVHTELSDGQIAIFEAMGKLMTRDQETKGAMS